MPGPLTPLARDEEHAIEIELPFLQRALAGEFSLLPVMVRTHDPRELQALGEALAEVMAGSASLLVASSDLSHFYPLPIANQLDAAMLARIAQFSPDAVLEAEETGEGFACGVGAVAAVLWAARALGANAVEIVHHSTSAERTGDESSVVGYGAAVILKGRVRDFLWRSATKNKLSKVMFVQVAVNVPTVSGVFDYHLPADLAGRVQPGCLLVVPFGRQMVQGVVVRLVEEAQVQLTRPVEALLDPLPVLTPAQLNLAGLLAQETLAPLAACIEVMLPPGLAQQADTLYHRNDPLPAHPALPATQQKILDLLAGRGDLRGRQFEALLPHLHVKEALLALTRRGFVHLPPGAAPARGAPQGGAHRPTDAASRRSRRPAWPGSARRPRWNGARRWSPSWPRRPCRCRCPGPMPPAGPI